MTLIGDRCTVVVVDDALLMRRIVSRMCAASGAMDLVGTASDGPSGVATVLDARPSVAIVDLDLPGFDGLEVSRRIHEAPGDAPRIVLWSGKTAPSEVAMHEAGIDAFVAKASGLGPLLTAAGAAWN